MNLNLSDYYKIISAFSFSAFHIIFSAIITALFVVVISLLVLFLLRKFVLVKRVHISLRILAISYFVLLPLLAGFWSFKWKLAENIRQELNSNVTGFSKTLDDRFKSGLGSISALTTDSTNQKQAFSINSAIDAFSIAVYAHYDSTLEGAARSETGLSGKIAAVVIKMTKGKATSYFIKKGIKKLAEQQVGLSPDVSEEVMDMKLNELLSNGLFSKILTLQIDHFFNGIKRALLISFCIILLFPFIEIVIALRLYQKRLKAATPIPPQQITK